MSDWIIGFPWPMNPPPGARIRVESDVSPSKRAYREAFDSLFITEVLERYPGYHVVGNEDWGMQLTEDGQVIRRVFILEPRP